MVTQAVVLAGGLGTRHGAAQQQTPKSLLQIDGMPFLDYVLWNVARHGIRRILLLTGHFVSAFQSHYGDGRAHGVHVEYAVEPEPRGTGGALALAATRLDDHFLLLNDDTLFDLNYLDLVGRVEDGALAGVALRRVDDVARYGLVRVRGGRVEAFAEKGENGPGAIDGGVYVMRREVVERLPAGKSSLERELLPALAAEGRLAGAAYDGFFVDIGTPELLAAARFSVPAWRRKPALFLDRDGTVNVDRGWVHRPEEFAWIEGAREAIRWANERGILVLVVTNQSGIGRGYYTEAEFQAFTRWMDDELARFGAHIDATYYCPHHPTEGWGEYRCACRCRKPAPGLVERALADWGLDRTRSILVGDTAHDLEAAAAAGIRSVRFEGGSLLKCVTRAFEASTMPVSVP
jgi:D-glycero-D-manno-heptose 1,7-bisphosphate phosphatase